MKKPAEFFSILGTIVTVMFIMLGATNDIQVKILDNVNEVKTTVHQMNSLVDEARWEVTDTRQIAERNYFDLKWIKEHLRTLSAPRRTQTSSPLPETRKRKVTRSSTNDYCAGSEGFDWPIESSDGWEIDEASIKHHIEEKNSESTTVKLKEKSPQGFRITGHIVNTGKCFRLLGKTLIKDQRGTLHVTATFTEKRIAR